MLNKFFIAVMLCMTLCGCALHPVNIKFFTSSVVNPDEHYRSLPVTVYLYQLKNKSQFMDADDDDLIKHSSETLNKSLVSAKKIILYPGDQKNIRANLSNDTQYIGVIGVFRRSGQWKSITKVKRKAPLIPSTMQVGVVKNRIYFRST